MLYAKSSEQCTKKFFGTDFNQIWLPIEIASESRFIGTRTKWVVMRDLFGVRMSGNVSEGGKFGGFAKLRLRRKFAGD